MNRLALKPLALFAALWVTQAQAQTQWVDRGSFGSYSGAYRGSANGGQGALSSESTSRPDPYSQSWAASSLVDGQLHARAITRQQPCTRAECSTTTFASAGAYYWETITFSNDRAAGDARLLLSIDGTLSPLGGQAAVRWFAGFKPADFWRDPSAYAPRTDLASGTTLIGDDLLVPLGQVTYFIYAQLVVTADSYFYGPGNPNPGHVGFADFGNTLHFNWTLPEGVTYRSASGHFMTAVPEPGSLAMMALGLVGVAAVRVRRASPPAGS